MKNQQVTEVVSCQDSDTFYQTLISNWAQFLLMGLPIFARCFNLKLNVDIMHDMFGKWCQEECILRMHKVNAACTLALSANHYT